MKKLILMVAFLVIAFACTQENTQKDKRLTVQEQAENMFRKPSGEEAKIEKKFQPIDHEIKQKANEQSH